VVLKGGWAAAVAIGAGPPATGATAQEIAGQGHGLSFIPATG